MTPDPNDFTHVFSNLFGTLVNQAEAGNTTLKFAIGQANVSTSLTIYGYTQCTPDLSQSDCRSCLSESISDISNHALPYQRGRMWRASYSIRYDVSKFSNVYDTLAIATPAPVEAPTRGRGKGSMTSKIVIGIVVALTAVFLVLVIAVYFFLKRQRREAKEKTNDEPRLEDDIISSTETFQFSYGDIKDATQNFAEANKHGRGGFGTVYKGVLANGKEIAVKRLASNSMQGEVEFRMEVLIVLKLQHRNLVRLLGFSLAGEERLLIYEYVPNASLDHFLFGETRLVSLDWDTHYKIIGGIARGLLYLHEDSRVRIIHRDLKASNILLDAQLIPKIADFGLARVFQADQTHADTKRIAGTYGYIAPEYAYGGVISFKSDVYNFGVLVLEIICGQKTSGIQKDDSMEGLIASVWRNWTEGTAYDVVDSVLLSASRDEIMRCIHIGLLCVQADAADRPTMSLVNLMLSSELISLPVPSQPAYILQRSFGTDLHLNTVQEESITDLHPR